MSASFRMALVRVVGNGTLGQRRAHDHTAHAGRGLEVSLAALSPAGRQVGVDLRHGGGDGRRGSRWVMLSSSPASTRTFRRCATEFGIRSGGLHARLGPVCSAQTLLALERLPLQLSVDLLQSDPPVLRWTCSRDSDAHCSRAKLSVGDLMLRDTDDTLCSRPTRNHAPSRRLRRGLSRTCE